MVDKISAERRSKNMAAIRSKGMKPEIIVRSLVHGLGFRYRLHRKDLPGKPDLVLSRLKTIIFVHGCFWHQHNHKGCLDGRVPKSNTAYWVNKLAGNVKRDTRARRALRKAGWRVIVIWECQTKDSDRLEPRLQRLLSSV